MQLKPAAVDNWKASANDLGVFNALSVVQWSPPLQTPADLRILNDDLSLLPYTYTLATNVVGSFTSMPVSISEP